MKPKISLCAAAARPRFWKRFYDSLAGNKVEVEVIFVGPNRPDFELPANFVFAQSNVKPCQAYSHAINIARGELIGWTADDVIYNGPIAACPNALDLIWEAYMRAKEEYGDNKTILSQVTIEDYGMRWNRQRALNFWRSHHFFNGNMTTPMMAPIGFISKEFFNQLGGYDRSFVCGQSENDICMRAYEVGGRVLGVEDSIVEIKHREAHMTDRYNFSKGYGQDRTFLQACWTENGKMVTKRRIPVQPFDQATILGSNQGPSGRWR